MGQHFDAINLRENLQEITTWIQINSLTLDNALQLGVMISAFAFALVITPKIRRAIGQLLGMQAKNSLFAATGQRLSVLTLPLTGLIVLWIASLAASVAGWSHHILTIATSLLAAWIIIRLAASVIQEKALAKAVSIAVWSIAALNIIGWLDPAVVILDSINFNLGDLRISMLTFIRGAIAFGILVWIAIALSRLTEKRISNIASLTPSLQVLLIKLVKITLITMTLLITVSAVGIDLTAFAVLGGAVGVGVGLGLQKSVANLISGVMILLDKSIKPGDVIEVGQNYGKVKSLGGRYASVITRDGVEHLIPNEELIAQQVSNWSHSSNEIRLHIPVGVSYNANVHRALELILEAALEVERVIADPPPVAQMKGFGESSVDLELRVWINDPMEGIANIKSSILLLIWDKFQTHGVELPFPQRDLHIKSTIPLKLAN